MFAKQRHPWSNSSATVLAPPTAPPPHSLVAHHSRLWNSDMMLTRPLQHTRES